MRGQGGLPLNLRYMSGKGEQLLFSCGYGPSVVAQARQDNDDHGGESRHEKEDGEFFLIEPCSSEENIGSSGKGGTFGRIPGWPRFKRVWRVQSLVMPDAWRHRLKNSAPLSRSEEKFLNMRAQASSERRGSRPMPSA